MQNARYSLIWDQDGARETFPHLLFGLKLGHGHRFHSSEACSLVKEVLGIVNVKETWMPRVADKYGYPEKMRLARF